MSPTKSSAQRSQSPPVVHGPLLVASGYPAPLLEPVYAPLYYVAPRVGHDVETRRPSGTPHTTLPLVAPLRDSVADPAPPQQSSTTRVAVAFVGNEVLWAFAGASGSTRKTGHPDGIEYRLKLRALVALARRHDDRERSPLPVAGEVHLARQSSPTTSDRLVRWMGDPLFTSRMLGSRLAPAACWWAQAMVLSTLTSHSRSPTAVDLVCAWASKRSQVPSRLRRTKRS